jgi:hypothetical protein
MAFGLWASTLGTPHLASSRYATKMVIQVMEFQVQGYKIRKIFAKKSTYPKEIIEL